VIRRVSALRVLLNLQAWQRASQYSFSLPTHRRKKSEASKQAEDTQVFESTRKLPDSEYGFHPWRCDGIGVANFEPCGVRKARCGGISCLDG